MIRFSHSEMVIRVVAVVGLAGFALGMGGPCDHTEANLPCVHEQVSDPCEGIELAPSIERTWFQRNMDFEFDGDPPATLGLNGLCVIINDSGVHEIV